MVVMSFPGFGSCCTSASEKVVLMPELVETRGAVSVTSIVIAVFVTSRRRFAIVSVPTSTMAPCVSFAKPDTLTASS